MNQFKEFSSEMEMIGSLPQTQKSLQRNDEWHLKRLPCWNGSENKDLMGCGHSTAKQPWGSLAKTYDFGATAEKHIYTVGQKRLTGLRDMDVSAKQMDWGVENEPKLIQQLIKDGIISDFEELGFEYFGDYHNGGASVDGKATYQGRKVALELKCCTSWDGHYKRMYEPVHERHDDFWQHQSEMLATGLDELLYVVAMPMQVEKYNIQIVKASKLHQEQLLKRCKIGDLAISLWGEYGYKEALQIACARFKENSNQ